MEENKVLMVLTENEKYLPREKIIFVRERLEATDETRFSYVTTLRYKNPVVALILTIFLGCLGIDRFYVGDVGIGILKLLTCGCCGLLALWDLFTIYKHTKDVNYYKIMSIIG